MTIKNNLFIINFRLSIDSTLNTFHQSKNPNKLQRYFKSFKLWTFYSYLEVLFTSDENKLIPLSLKSHKTKTTAEFLTSKKLYETI